MNEIRMYEIYPTYKNLSRLGDISEFNSIQSDNLFKDRRRQKKLS